MELSQKIKETTEVLQYLSLTVGLPDVACKSYAKYNFVSTGKEGQSGHDGDVVTNKVELGSDNQLSDFRREARTVWQRKLADLLESNPIGEDAVPFFDTDHPSSVTKLGCNTYSNKAGLVKLSEEGIKHVVGMLKSISNNVDGVTHIAIVVPTLDMFDDTWPTSGYSSVINSCKVKCSATFNPYLKDKENWYVFDTSDKFYELCIEIQEPLSFNSGSSFTENDIKTEISYKTKGSVHLGPARKVVRATHF